MNAVEIIKHLQLQPHPEGGFYRETYRSDETTINLDGAERNVCTAIYFLLQGNNKSHFHRIRSDELWFFHLGEPIEIVWFREGTLHSSTLGPDLASGSQLFLTIPSGCWFAARVKEAKGFSLVSCTVSPGFDFRDFELAEREKLIQEFPRWKELIEELSMP